MILAKCGTGIASVKAQSPDWLKKLPAWKRDFGNGIPDYAAEIS